MSRQVAKLDAAATLREAADKLAATETGVLVVVDQDRTDAVVSERDIVQSIAVGGDVDVVTVGEVASHGLVWCDVHDDAAELASRMAKEGVRHILVSQEGQLVGLVSARDLLQIFVG